MLGATALGPDLNCRDFSDQASAQAILDAEPSDPHRLDADNDGVACESFPFSGAIGASCIIPCNRTTSVQHRRQRTPLS